MKSKQTAIFVVIALAVAGGAFYGGLQYAKASAKTGQTRQFGAMQGQGLRGTGQPGAPGGRNAGGFASGQVLSKDSSSLTVKLRDGGSKIVFYSASTTVSKTTDGSMDDVTQDSDVMITGTPNPDGSITAQTVQLRPKGEVPPPGR
jgi:hypothetical protein